MSSTSTPQYLICPITLELFNDPVTTEDGYTYERKAIIEWINRHGTSPISRKSLNINQLTSNHIIKDAVEAFKHQQTQHNVMPNVSTTHTNTSGEKRQTLDNLDVLCRYCGSTQQLISVNKHQLQCSSNPVNIVPFDIADNEIIFQTPQQNASSNKPFLREKILSFNNPLAHRTTNPSITIESNQVSTGHNTKNSIHAELYSKNRFLWLKNHKVKCLVSILLAIILTTIAITLTVYYTKRQNQELLPAAPTTFTSTSATTATTTTSTSTMVPITTTTFTSTMTSTLTITSTPTSSYVSTPQPPCVSAEWSLTGITVASNLYDPNDLAIDSQDNIIIADTEHHRLQKYFNNGTNITLVEDVKARSIFIDKFDNIYIAVSFIDEVKILNSNGVLITTLDGSNISNSFYDRFKLDTQSGLYVDKNNAVYISDTGNHRVIKYFIDLNYGIIAAGEHGQGSELNQLNGPYGIYVDEVNEIGAIYICDHQNHRIQKWLNGAKEGITVAIHDDQLHSPMSILLQATADLMIMYISSYYHEQVLKWLPYAPEPESIVVGLSGHMGTEADRLFGPKGIKFDKDWNLFVADAGNNRIQKFLFNTSSCKIII